MFPFSDPHGKLLFSLLFYTEVSSSSYGCMRLWGDVSGDFFRVRGDINGETKQGRVTRQETALWPSGQAPRFHGNIHQRKHQAQHDGKPDIVFTCRIKVSGVSRRVPCGWRSEGRNARLA